MRRRISAPAAAAAFLLLTAHPAAYGEFCSDTAAAPVMAGYSAGLISAAEQFEAALNSHEAEQSTSEAAEIRPEDSAAELYGRRLGLYEGFCIEHSSMEHALAEKLISYDLLLEKLKAGSQQYSRLKENAGRLSQKYLIGECSAPEKDEAEKLCSDKYYELQSLMFDISALKSDIESQTGETLSSGFDFSSAYLITDALRLSPEELSDWGSPGTICVPDGAEYTPQAADITAQYNEAVQGYYSLGEALRSYISAAEAYEKGSSEAKLGTVSAEELDMLLQEYGDARLEALQKKADYSISLLKLDELSGGALTANAGTSSGLCSALCSALPENMRGSGLWQVRRSRESVRLIISAYPFSFDPEKDTVRFELWYAGSRLTSGTGNTAEFTAPEPVMGKNRAVVRFYINGALKENYNIDIYSPFGGFLEG